MKTIQELYNAHVNGEVSKEKFLYESRRDLNLSQYINNFTSYDDSIKILKNRGIITEAKKKLESLTLDNANPYEVKKGLDYELDLCYKQIPREGIKKDDYLKAQKKVLANLSKDPNFYTKIYAGVKPDSTPDLASSIGLNGGKDSKRTDTWTLVKDNNFIDKKQSSQEIGKKEQSNVQDTLGNKERAKNKNPKGIQIMSMIPKKAKGVKVMAMPGKEKKFKIKLKEDIAASTSKIVPFAQVKPGMTAVDDSGDQLRVLATGDYNNLKRYDSSKSMDKFISSDPSGIDANQLVALIDGDGNTFVRIYGTGGVYVYQNSNTQQESSVVVKPNSPESDPNNLKKYTDKGYDVKLDSSIKEYGDESNDEATKMEHLRNSVTNHAEALQNFIRKNGISITDKLTGKDVELEHVSDDGKNIVSKIAGWGLFGTRHDDEGNVIKYTTKPDATLNEEQDFGSDISDRQVPPDEEAQAEAKAGILVTITKAKLQGNVDLDSDVMVKGGYIWVRVQIGAYGVINNEQLKALTSDSKFKGLNPISDTEVTLVFDKK